MEAVRKPEVLLQSTKMSIEAGEIITYSGKSFPVSRLLVKDIKERYMNYIFTGEV